ncbi:MAG TPA: DUF433 domain-containing protein [Candidatus Binatia bacterium]|nr:DUF433 domain-containing protein [Candidatus Binatia bacterium]
MNAKIIDRGRGPEIAGTRITVYDVVDYLQEGWRYEQIAALFRLPPDDIQAALQYIEDHKDEVMTAYRQILARHCNVHYPSAVQEKLAQNRRKLQAKLAEIQARQQAADTHADDQGGS